MPKKGNMLNSPCCTVTLAYSSTCSQGYPQKIGRQAERDGLDLVLLYSLVRSRGRSVFAAGSWMATSMDCLWPDFTVASRRFSAGYAS